MLSEWKESSNVPDEQCGPQHSLPFTSLVFHFRRIWQHNKLKSYYMYKNNTPFYTSFHKLKITFLYYFSVRSCFWLDIEKVIRDGKKKNGHSGRRENILFLFYMYFMYNKEESESCMAWHGIQIPIIQVLRSPDHFNRCSQHLIKNSHPFCLSQKVCKLLTKQKRTFLFIQQRQH